MSTPSADPVQRARAEVGTILKDKWRLDELLGVGSLSSTYAATHRGGNRVAVRVLHEWLREDRELAEAFVKDAYVANRIDHRGIVAVYDDDFTERGAPFVVLELLEGETVEARWTRCGHRLALLEVLWVVDQTLDALAAAHEKGIVHGRIRAANLFLTSQSALKVMDFGTARIRAPSGSQPDPRADLRAVGAMMVALLAGRSSGGTMEATAPELPAPVAQLIGAALAHDGSEQLEIAALRESVRRAFEAQVRSPIADDATSTSEVQITATEPGGSAPAGAQPVRKTIRMDAPDSSPPEGDRISATMVDVSPAQRAGDGAPAAAEARGAPSTPPFKAAGSRTVAEMSSEQPKSATGTRLILAGELAYVYIQRALAREESGDLAGAIDDYTRALERLPSHALAYYNRGSLRQASEDLRGALEDYDRAVSLAPDLAEAHYNAAIVRWRLGDDDAAATACEMARKLYAERRDPVMGRQAAALLDRLRGRA
jgi:serine/threonine-protein kinase